MTFENQSIAFGGIVTWGVRLGQNVLTIVPKLCTMFTWLQLIHETLTKVADEDKTNAFKFQHTFSCFKSLNKICYIIFRLTVFSLQTMYLINFLKFDFSSVLFSNCYQTLGSYSIENVFKAKCFAMLTIGASVNTLS